jgi:hypothetical protein
MLPIIIVGLLVFIGVGFYLIGKGVVKNPIPGIVNIPTSSVELKPEYKNPLDKEAQYTNPFSDYKNPFDSLK